MDTNPANYKMTAKVQITVVQRVCSIFKYVDLKWIVTVWVVMERLCGQSVALIWFRVHADHL